MTALEAIEAELGTLRAQVGRLERARDVLSEDVKTPVQMFNVNVGEAFAADPDAIGKQIVAAVAAAKTVVTEKRCLGCDKMKPLEAFHRHPNAAAGRNPRCKACLSRKTTAPAAPASVASVPAKALAKETKRCSTCRKDLPRATAYVSNKHNSDGLARNCRDCMNVAQARSRKRERDAIAERKASAEGSSDPASPRAGTLLRCCAPLRSDPTHANVGTAPACGAIVSAKHTERHLAEVHGLEDVTDDVLEASFGPIADADEEED